MADISVIKLPTGNSYNIKDSAARTDIATEASTRASEVTRLEGLIGSITSIKFVVAWDGASTPVVANIPAGVVVTYNGTNYTGTKTAASADEGTFYLVHSSSETSNAYDEYVIVGSTPYWEKIGTTDVDLSGYVTNVTLNKQTDVVLGEATTFTNSSSTVSFSGGTTDVVLGEATTFTASGTAVGRTTKYVTFSASGTAVGANGTANAVTGYSNVTTDSFLQDSDISFSKLVTTTVPNVTNAGSASTWSFSMGTGNDAETLIISGANSVAPTLGTAKTVATGATSDTGGGSSIVVDAQANQDHVAITALGTPATATVLTGVRVTSQPSITRTIKDTQTTGSMKYVESIDTITQPTITVGTNDKVTAIKTLGTGTAAAQTITVGTNDKVTVLKSTTDVSVDR